MVKSTSPPVHPEPKRDDDDEGSSGRRGSYDRGRKVRTHVEDSPRKNSNPRILRKWRATLQKRVGQKDRVLVFPYRVGVLLLEGFSRQTKSTTLAIVVESTSKEESESLSQSRPGK